jgi:hypothetical protein
MLALAGYECGVSRNVRALRAEFAAELLCERGRV